MRDDNSSPVRVCGKRVYPWREMRPGQSFFVEAETALRRKQITAIAAGYAKRHPEYSFVSRKEVSPDGVTGIRIWRVKPA